jgi:hypothetical protein
MGEGLRKSVSGRQVSIIIRLPSEMYQELRRHLIRGVNANEEAAFAFAHFDERIGVFTVIEHHLVPPEGFAVQLPYHFELSDQTKAHVIKRAHDLGVSLIEIHSHTGRWKPQFSASDWAGFEEVVPHIRWRLNGRPYAAVVMARDGFDALAWVDGSKDPVRLDALDVDGQILEPSKLSPLERDGYDWTL